MFFFKKKDGGSESKVTGYWVVECKSLFSIVLLKFDKGSREVYHSHAFNAITWWLWGNVVEHLTNGGNKTFVPSLVPKYTPRSCFHKVFANETTYALSIRGPWHSTWCEMDAKTHKVITLTHGRNIKGEV